MSFLAKWLCQMIGMSACTHDGKPVQWGPPLHLGQACLQDNAVELNEPAQKILNLKIAGLHLQFLAALAALCLPRWLTDWLFWIYSPQDQNKPNLPDQPTWPTFLTHLTYLPTRPTHPPDLPTHLTYPPICPTHQPDLPISPTHPDNLPEPTTFIT